MAIQTHIAFHSLKEEIRQQSSRAGLEGTVEKNVLERDEKELSDAGKYVQGGEKNHRNDS